MRLSTLTVENLAYQGKQKTVFDDQLPGFGIRVGKKAKTFVLMVGRERKLHSLGRYPVISLKIARQEALRLLADRDTRKHAKPRLRASEAITAFMTEKRAQNRPETLRQLDRVLTTYLKAIHHKFIEDVNTDDITKVTDTFLKEGKGATANLILTVSKTFLKWCVKRRLIPHSPVEGLDLPAKSQQRERVLTDQELRAVWTAADATEGRFGAIIKLLILIGARRNEIGQLKPAWLDLEKQTLSLPSEFTKNGRSHHIPIGELSTTILREMAGVHTFAYIFATRERPNSSFTSWPIAKKKLDKFAPIPHWTLHDLRRTYATNLQRLGIRLEIIESLLNHQSGTRSGIVRVYQRYGFWEEMVAATSLYELWITSTIFKPEG